MTSRTRSPYIAHGTDVVTVKTERPRKASDAASMNLLIINQYAIPPTQAGITRHYMLARELYRLGHNVTIVASSFDHVTRRETRLSPGEWYRVETIDGIRFLWMRAPPYQGNTLARVRNMLIFAATVWRGVGLESLEELDAIIGSSPHLFGALAAERVARRLKVPFVLEVRDLWPQSLVELGQFRKRHPVVVALAMIEKHLYRRARRIVTLLPRSIDHIVSRGGDPEKITWIPNGVDLEANMESGDHHEAESKFVVMYAGTHGLANALDSVLDAAALLQNETGLENVELRLVGDGPDKKRLQQRVNDESIHNVVFERPVPKNTVATKLASADAFIVTLRDIELYRHGTSLNKIYDYLAAGRPVIFGTNDEDNPVSVADAGVRVPPEDAWGMADAIKRLAAMSVVERKAMGERGRRYVSDNHDLRGLGERLERLLCEVVPVAEEAPSVFRPSIVGPRNLPSK